MGGLKNEAETTHQNGPKRPTSKVGRNDPGRNDPAETTHGRNDSCPKRLTAETTRTRLNYRQAPVIDTAFFSCLFFDIFLQFGCYDVSICIAELTIYIPTVVVLDKTQHYSCLHSLLSCQCDNDPNFSNKWSSCGAYNSRNGPEWASITGMDIKINLFYAIKFIILP